MVIRLETEEARLAVLQYIKHYLRLGSVLVQPSGTVLLEGTMGSNVS